MVVKIVYENGNTVMYPNGAIKLVQTIKEERKTAYINAINGSMEYEEKQIYELRLWLGDKHYWSICSEDKDRIENIVEYVSYGFGVIIHADKDKNLISYERN